MDDGTLLLYSLDGGLFTLGPADPALAPRVAVSTAYPASGEPVTFTVDAPRADTNYTIAWGDGAITENGSSWTHRFGGDGTRTVRVTAQFADGRTATTETLVRVGATPPADLNTLQRAFAPENQDLTFGLLGLALTLGAGGIAVLARRRRHSRLRDDLRALARIRDDGRTDPEGAVLALGAYRERLFADLEAGRVDDAQFHTLVARADATFGALRTRLLGPLAGRLTADFRHALDVVLHDGRVDADERVALRAALDAERHATEEERARIVALLDRLGRSQ